MTDAGVPSSAGGPRVEGDVDRPETGDCTRWHLVPGVVVEPLGHLWATYSPASGETSLVNDECVAVLDELTSGALTRPELCRRLASAVDVPLTEVETVVEGTWDTLVHAGLVRQCVHDPPGA